MAHTSKTTCLGYIVLATVLCVAGVLWLLPRRPDIDGTWVSDDPAARWRLDISGDRVRWTERRSGDAELVRELTVDTSRGEFRLERENDEHVLEFLGFASDRLAAVRASRPQPSRLDVRYEEGLLKAEWRGILVTLDEQGRPADVSQPDDTPPKLYTLRRAEAPAGAPPLPGWCENPFSHPFGRESVPARRAGWESCGGWCEMGISHQRSRVGCILTHHPPGSARWC